jgi:hypothetical protein
MIPEVLSPRLQPTMAVDVAAFQVEGEILEEVVEVV